MMLLLHFIFIFHLATEQCNGYNDPQKESVVDYNVGFDPKIWVQWLDLCNLKPSGPVAEAVSDIQKDNFLVKHRKLEQSEVILFCVIINKYFMMGEFFSECTLCIFVP